MRTAFLPRNWLKLIFSPVVPGSVKSGAFAPTSRAGAALAPTSTPASSAPNSNQLLVSFGSLLMCPSPCLQSTILARPTPATRAEVGVSMSRALKRAAHRRWWLLLLASSQSISPYAQGRARRAGGDLLLPWIVRRVDVGDAPRANPVNLDD